MYSTEGAITSHGDYGILTHHNNRFPRKQNEYKTYDYSKLQSIGTKDYLSWWSFFITPIVNFLEYITRAVQGGSPK